MAKVKIRRKKKKIKAKVRRKKTSAKKFLETKESVREVDPARAKLEAEADRACNLPSCCRLAEFNASISMYARLLELLKESKADKLDVERVEAKLERVILKRKGVQDLRGIQMGVWKGGVRLNEEEILELEEGATEMAAKKKVKVKKGKKVKGKKAATKKAAGSSPVGKTTGLRIQPSWVHVLQKNEKLKGSKQLTDEQISSWIKKEFPGRNSKVFDDIKAVRRAYNAGKLTKGEVPKVVSHGYDKKGKKVELKRGRKSA